MTKIAAWYNDARAITLAIQRQPGTNTVEVVDAVKDLVNKLRAEIPASIRLDLLYDRSVSIRDSVRDIKTTLFLAICLVIPGHLSIPAQPLGHDHPQPGPPVFRSWVPLPPCIFWITASTTFP